MHTTPSKYRSLAASILLFLIVFGIWQAYDFALTYVSLTPILITILSYFVLYGISLAILLLFIKLGKSTLREQGFKQPSNPAKFILLSIGFAIFYILVMLAPGFLFGFSTRASPDFLFIILNTSRAILIAITTEAIFRGYIFRNLVRNYGFFISLYASSILFGLHRYDYPISIRNILTMGTDEIIRETFFQQILPVFTSGLFLGFLFYKMDWSILGPFVFRFGTLLYFFLSPVVASSVWWMGLTFEVTAYAVLIVIADSAIIEPRYRRKRYRLES